MIKAVLLIYNFECVGRVGRALTVDVRCDAQTFMRLGRRSNEETFVSSISIELNATTNARLQLHHDLIVDECREVRIQFIDCYFEVLGGNGLLGICYLAAKDLSHYFSYRLVGLTID